MGAELIEYDRQTDVALLEVNQAGLPALGFAVDKLKEGQSVLGMGSSLQLPVSSSLGIVSGLNVELPGKKNSSLIQTDVAFNPGASGGPLLNSDGQVVGLLGQIYSSTGNFSGMSFAVPVDEIKTLLDKWRVTERLSPGAQAQ